jgi:hypothetical protein
MYLAADSRLSGTERSNLVYITTKSLADQYWLERTGASGIEMAYQRTESGMDKLMFNGIDVIPFNFLDRIIRTYFKETGAYVYPHRAILTTKDNLMIGTASVGSLGELDGFHDKKAKDYNVDWGAAFDAKIGLDYKIVAAY